VSVKTEFLAIEDRLTGGAAKLRELYRGAFTEAEAARLALETKKQNRKMALLILLVMLVVIAAAVLNASADIEPGLDLSRPGAGDAPKTLEAEVSAEYDGYTAKERAAIRILPREPSPEEAEAMLRALEQRLPGIILGDNASLDAVLYDLRLPGADPDTGAEFSWRSSDTHIISNEGEVNLVGVDAGSAVTLTVYIRFASAMSTFHIVAKTGEGVPEERIDKALKARLTEAVREASGSRDGEEASLPSETPDGVKLTWTAPVRDNGEVAVVVCVLFALFCYTQRFRSATRYIEKARADMERDFPDFIQKLGLLLGAGLVTASAISRITDDYIGTREIYGRRCLYEEIAAARERMRASGTPLIYEFSELARRSGLRELMRFSSTLADNIDKGSTLADKLRAENELLWESRKKRAEKESRLAETKLIFPMALQILAVIAITVMPAAFEMS